MNRRFGLLLVLASALVPLHATTAWSQDNPARQEASARLKAGLAFANQGKWEKARLSFLQAYAVLPSVDLLWNLAFAELKSGHPLEALEHFAAYEIEPKAEPGKVAALPKFRERAYQQIGRVTVQAPAGTSAWLDGAAQGVGEPINVVPGDHRVKVKLGDQTEERRVSVPAGQAMVLAFSLVDPTSPPATASTADGLDVASAAPSVSPSAGSSPTPAETPAPASAAPTRSRSRSPALGWIGVGAGAGALAVGLGYALAASSKASDVKSARANGDVYGCHADPTLPPCVAIQDSADKHDTYSKISTVSFVAAGVLGVAGFGYLLLSGGSRSVAVSPYASPRQSGMVLRAQF